MPPTIWQSGRVDFAVGELIFVLLAQRGGEWAVILKLYTEAFTKVGQNKSQIRNFNT